MQNEIKIVVENDNTKKKKLRRGEKILEKIIIQCHKFPSRVLSFDGHHAEYHQHVFISFYYSERIFLNYKTFSNFLKVLLPSSRSLYDPIVLVIKVE